MAAYIRPEEKFSFFLVNVLEFNEKKNVYIVNDVSDVSIHYECTQEHMVDFLSKKYNQQNISLHESIYALFNDELLTDSLKLIDPNAPSYMYMTTEFYPAIITDIGKDDIKVRFKEGESQRIRYTDFFLKSDCQLPKKKLK